MSDTRRPVYDAPFGSPSAGEVKVFRVNPETGEKTLVREEDPFDSDLQPGTTLPSGPRSELARGQDPRKFEQAE